jgi:hypothetical protein
MKIINYTNYLNEDLEEEESYTIDPSLKLDTIVAIVNNEGGVSNYNIRKMSDYLYKLFGGKRVKFFTTDGEVDIIVKSVEVGVESGISNGKQSQQHGFYFYGEDGKRYSVKTARKITLYKKFNPMDPYGEENW